MSCPSAGCGRSARPVRRAGCGNGVMVRLLRHRQTKGAATDRLHLRPPRHISTLPKSVIPLFVRSADDPSAAMECRAAMTRSQRLKQAMILPHRNALRTHIAVYYLLLRERPLTHPNSPSGLVVQCLHQRCKQLLCIDSVRFWREMPATMIVEGTDLTGDVDTPAEPDVVAAGF